MKLIIGISGASGAVYGVRLLQVLKDVRDVETHLILSKYGRMNVELETPLSARDVESLADEVHNPGNQAAVLSSGSFKTDGMIVAPCSMKTLSAIVYSFADSLIPRAADVTLKERRPLVLMPRETPLHVGHCELLYKAAQLGAIIAPPVPAFYNKPQTLDDIVDHTVGRILDLFGIDSGVVKRWGGANDTVRPLPRDISGVVADNVS
jgi:4-hydroxy-3-polyprenylbenzoate decarboxylase